MAETPEHSHHYLIRAACPGCAEVSTFVETFDNRVPLDKDIPPSAEYCPRCGVNVNESEGCWDIHEEARIQRVQGGDS